MPGWFATALGQGATQAASGAIGIGIQRLGVNYDMRKQAEQAQRLQDIQMAGEKEMIDYSKAADLKMWQNTSYPAQMALMKQAGLNPALMYGQGGGGGQTTGGGAPSVSGQSAENPHTANAALQGMGMMNAAQVALLNAQKKNVDADTANKEAENPNIPKQGNLLDVQAKSLTQGIQNQQAVQALTQAQTKSVEIANKIASASADDQIAQIGATLEETIAHVKSAMAQANVDEATQQAKIDLLKEQAVGQVLQNTLTKAQTAKTKSDIKVNQQVIQKMVQDIAQGWKDLDIKGKEQKVNGVIQEYKAQFEGNLSKWLPANAQTMAKQIDAILGISSSDFKGKQK